MKRYYDFQDKETGGYSEELMESSALEKFLEDNPNLKTFKVKKSGEGMETRYTVIPLS